MKIGWRRLGLALAVALAVLVAWEPSRVAMQTAALLPNLFGSGPMPLTVFSEAPTRTALPYRKGNDRDLAELWLPAWASAEKPAGAMLLIFGVNNLGRNHPVIERVADGLARTGVAVLVPDSRTLLEGRLEVGEIDGVVQAFELLVSRPEVDPERVGIVGFSVGGSLALLAAADPRISGNVRWVNAFGAFAEAATYLTSVAAHAYIGPSGEPVDWQPTPLAREVFVNFLLSQVTNTDDSAVLRSRYAEAVLAGERPAPDVALRESLRTDAGRAVHDLLTAESLVRARTAIAALPVDSRAFIDAISPARQLAGIEADVYLMHEIDDFHVPYVESRALADALRERGLLAAHTEFRLFDHVQPDDLDLLAAAPELWKLLWHVHALMVETL